MELDVRVELDVDEELDVELTVWVVVDLGAG